LSTLQLIGTSFAVIVAGLFGYRLGVHPVGLLRADLARAVHIATHDRLTGLPNRVALRGYLAEREAAHQPMVFAILNVDGFAAVNHRYGHRAGDQLLVLLTAAITEHMSYYGGTAFRLGRDEVALIWPDQTAADALAARLLYVVAQPVDLLIDGYAVPVSVGASIGCEVVGGWQLLDQSVLLRHSDTALQRARADGGGRCVVYRPGMERLPRRRG
jgi:diguanylate cyclase (GGDEF)-like protein